tara:strand:- start:1696 stop:2334 length:639 start_codon:yes stop_codon:yes gene_type:complete
LHHSIINLVSIQNTLKTNKANIIAVSKTFPVSEILPLVEQKQIHFGENKVQEAVEKWTKIKREFKDIKLHMIGKLQTNKVKFVVPLFDYIHSLDSIKLAQKINQEQNKIKKNLKIFVQVNIGNEEQKSGIKVEDLEEFYKKCMLDFNLNIVGLMCLPPKNINSNEYFLKMKNLAMKLNIKELSMGMSNDYLDAANCGSTFLRIGSKIFGNRN